jgi:DNA-binding IclR family transcriptional regulator
MRGHTERPLPGVVCGGLRTSEPIIRTAPHGAVTVLTTRKPERASLTVTEVREAMTARVTAGLRAVQEVAARVDPTAPMASGALARALGMSLSSVSRLCAELVDVGLLERTPSYGAYRLGPAATQLSGRAQAPFVQTLRAALTGITRETGETALVAAATGEGMQVTGVVSSPWTLFSPAHVGERVTDGAIAAAAARFGGGAPGDGRVVVEQARGKCVEVAVPILEPDGVSVAVLAVRLPVNRAKQGVAAARRVLATARRAIEHRVNEHEMAPPPPRRTEAGASALAATVAILESLAGTTASASELAAATGLRRDRVGRLIESCRRAGLVHLDTDGERLRLSWTVHGWLRASVSPTLVAHGSALVARAADVTGACAFITVLRGMRSVTLVEELRDQGAGLEMTPWLGRPCPLVSSDGGPTLVQDFTDDDITELLGKRVDRRESTEFLARTHAVARHGVIAKESFEEAGQTAVSAPVRDASGAVVAAACLVGATDLLRPKLSELERVARDLAAELSALLGGVAVRELASTA